MRRTWRYRLIVAVMLTAFPVALWFAWFTRAADSMGRRFSDAQFSPSAWKAMKDSQNRDGRAGMARDLIDNYLWDGMLERKTMSLLGTPDKIWPAGEYGAARHDVYEYDMGQAPMDMAGQHYVLRLYFNNQGRYKRAEITRD